jgi:hypothetical protein
VIARKDETRLRVLTPERVGNKYDLLLISIRSITSVHIIVQLIKTLDKLGQALKSNRCWALLAVGQPGHNISPRLRKQLVLELEFWKLLTELLELLTGGVLQRNAVPLDQQVPNASALLSLQHLGGA